jgi:hypothetical protein
VARQLPIGLSYGAKSFSHELRVSAASFSQVSVPEPPLRVWGLTGVAFQEIAIGTTNGFVAHGIGANGVIAGSTVGSVTLNGDDVVARVLCLR